MAIFDGKKSSNYIIINDKMIDDEEVASDVPARHFLTTIMSWKKTFEALAAAG